VLLRSDVGVATTALILDDLRVNGAPDGVATAVRATLLDSLSAERTLTTSAQAGRVPVWLFVGVNGVGKTTTIGKLAKRLIDEGRSVVLAAGDTFRAAAAINSNSGRPGPGLTSFVRPRARTPDRSCTTPWAERPRGERTSCSPIPPGVARTARTCWTN